MTLPDGDGRYSNNETARRLGLASLSTAEHVLDATGDMAVQQHKVALQVRVAPDHIYVPLIVVADVI
jgi:hypothetical protein